jgi:hypothetical protein
LQQITVSGTGTNPFTGVPGGNLQGDAFYYWGDNLPAQAYDSFNGFYIQNAKFSPIPTYNAQHKYTVNWTGDGNPILMRYADSTSHADNANVPLLVTICGAAAGNFTR